MKKVKLSTLLINILSTASCYLTKMEMLLIFTLSITSSYVINMEMLLAETKPLNSPETMIVKTIKQDDGSNIEQSLCCFKRHLSNRSVEK